MADEPQSPGQRAGQQELDKQRLQRQAAEERRQMEERSGDQRQLQEKLDRERAERRRHLEESAKKALEETAKFALAVGLGVALLWGGWQLAALGRGAQIAWGVGVTVLASTPKAEAAPPVQEPPKEHKTVVEHRTTTIEVPPDAPLTGGTVLLGPGENPGTVHQPPAQNPPTGGGCSPSDGGSGSDSGSDSGYDDPEYEEPDYEPDRAGTDPTHTHINLNNMAPPC